MPKMETDKPIVLSEISEDEKRLVESQLETILASTYFNSAKQMRRFLEYIVDKTLAGEGSLLKQYTIGIDALELPEDFDSVSNPIVRIMGGRVRNRLKEFYDNTDNNKIVITIPKGSYTPQFNRNPENTASIKPDRRIKDKEVETSTGPTIALVSFTDKTQSNLSNRLTLQVTNKLAQKLSNLVLITVSVYNSYADKSKARKVYQEIESDYKLYLCIQELPNEKHELLCRLSGVNAEILWSENYYIKTKIALDEQEGIFANLITQIIDTDQGKLHSDWSRKLLLNKDSIPDKFQAVAYYWQYHDNLNDDTFTKAVEICEKALERNSNDIIAIILLCDLCRVDYIYRYNLIDTPLDKGVQYAKKAIHLRPDSQAAHFVLGRMLYTQGDRDRGLEELFRARDLGHYNAHVEYVCGFYLCAMERWDEGIPMVNRAMSMSENYPSWYNMITSLAFYIKGNYQEAIIEAEKIMAPSIAYGPMARCIAYAKFGDIDKAKNELKELAIRMPKLEKNGRATLIRYFGNEKLAEKIWEGVEIAIKG